MQNLYPLFERNRVLKKELLWSLRDYSFAQAQLDYGEYAEGILRGCDVRVEEGRIVVSPGIIKYGGFLYLMAEEESVMYGACNEYVAVRMSFHTEQAAGDYVCYGMELVSDKDINMKEGEFELCRYKLQEGAVLRDKHTCFEDLNTEYNTLNYMYASWGGLRGKAVSPYVTRWFAREILEAKKPQPEDINFAYLCLSQPGAVAMEILSDYIARKNGGKKGELAGEDAFQEMWGIIRKLNNATERQYQERLNRRTIVVD